MPSDIGVMNFLSRCNNMRCLSVHAMKEVYSVWEDMPKGKPTEEWEVDTSR